MSLAASSPVFEAAPDARRPDPLLRLLSGTAVIAAVGGVLAIAVVLRLADAGPMPAELPVAQAPAVVGERDPSVPDAASALAGSEAPIEEAAPTF